MKNISIQISDWLALKQMALDTQRPLYEIIHNLIQGAKK